MTLRASPHILLRAVKILLGFLWFFLVFIKEFIASNIALAKVILFKSKSTFKPGFIEYSIQGMTRIEVFFLAQSITLTPGTTTVEVDFQREILIIHAFDAHDPEQTISSIDQSLKKAILRFTR